MVIFGFNTSGRWLMFGARSHWLLAAAGLLAMALSPALTDKLGLLLCALCFVAAALYCETVTKRWQFSLDGMPLKHGLSVRAIAILGLMSVAVAAIVIWGMLKIATGLMPWNQE